MFFLLLACADPIDGTWMFTLEVTGETGEECTEPEVTHNFTGAYVPTAAEGSAAWSETEVSTLSSSLFFGRIEATGDAYTLIVGNDVFPGTETEKGWSFAWTQSSAHDTDQLHATGYGYGVSTEREDSTTIAGTFGDEGFSGTWEKRSLSLDAWDESDTWAEEAALTVGETGQIPVADYLTRLDEYGAEVPVSNTREAFDCGQAQCALTVQSSCTYSYAVTAEPTEFLPEDNRWVEDATQAPGA